MQSIHTESRNVPTVQFVCPRCDAEFVCALDAVPGRGSLACAQCCLSFSSGREPAAMPLEECRVCGNKEFYIQKDFNRQLGLWIVITSFLVVFLVMLLVDHRVGIYLLVALAIVDWLAYRKLANVTVCYLCQSVFRGLPLHPEHRGFYLGLEEKHKQLRQKWLEELLDDHRETPA